MRYLKLVAVIFILVAALLVFPNRIPEFAGCWLCWCIYRQWKGSLTRLELAAIPVWILIKWPEPTISLGLFFALVCAAVCWFPDQRKIKSHCLMAIGLSWLGWLGQHHLGTHGTDRGTNAEGPIVCLGDSLTDYGYPDELRKLIPTPVEDFGFNGYTTLDGLKLIPEIIALKPSKVVIELGGHDFKNGEPRSQTADNLRKLIDSFHACGADVLLVEIPRGFINDPWYGMDRQLAREYDLDLVPDTMIRTLVYWSPVVPPGSLVSRSLHLSEDGLHPTAKGNVMMAKKIAGYLER